MLNYYYPGRVTHQFCTLAEFFGSTRFASHRFRVAESAERLAAKPAYLPPIGCQ